MICAAKPRDSTAAAREHRRVLAPSLLTPITPGTSPCHTPGKVGFEMSQRRVLLVRIIRKVRQVQACMFLPSSKGSRQPRRRLFHSILQPRRCRRTRSGHARVDSMSNGVHKPDRKFVCAVVELPWSISTNGAGETGPKDTRARFVAGGRGCICRGSPPQFLHCQCSISVMVSFAPRRTCSVADRSGGRAGVHDQRSCTQPLNPGP